MAEKNVETPATLVKYNNPVLVIKHPEKIPPETKVSPRDKTGRLGDSGFGETKKETEEILNSILPPRCWEEDGQLWTQTVNYSRTLLKY